MVEEEIQLYDEKVDMVLKQLGMGKSREKLAEELGYTTYKSIDMYMRRKKFVWDSRVQNYTPDTRNKGAIIQDDTRIPTSIAYTVISLFEKNKPLADPKAISRLAGFKDHLEMAGYMKSKNYKWDSTKQNYIYVCENENPTDQLYEADIVEKRDNENLQTKTFESITQQISNSNGSLDRFLPLLETLEKYKNELMDTIIPDRDESKIPRYIIPSVYITKSVHMASTLDRLVREFSREKNISQRDIFEIALTGFFRQYGYRKEINAILNK